MKAKTDAHQACQQQQHFVADEVPEVVIDMLEMVDVNHRQPEAAAAAGVAPLVGHAVDGDVLRQRCLEEGAIKGLAVEQFSQCIALAIVKQALKIEVQAQHATDQSAQFLRQRLMGGNFKHANSARVAAHRKYRDAGI